MKYLVLMLVLTGCAHVKIPDFKAHITLPASGDGYWQKTVSPEEGRIPKAIWDEQKKRGITIMPEDWAILKPVLQENCLRNECRDIEGFFDGLFFNLDAGLKKTQQLKK